MSDTRTAIKDTLDTLTTLRRVGKHLAKVGDDISTQTAVVEDLGVTLDRELKDFERLQRLSVRGLFYKALGSKEEQVEKERQEYLKANLMYQAEMENLELLQYEAEVLSKKAKDIEPLEVKLEVLYQRRSEEILKLDNQVSDQLKEVYQRVDMLTIFSRELAEADDASKVAVSAGQAVLSHLDNALRWGQWDMSQRRGSRYDYQKRSAIDRAIRAATEMQRALVILSRELDDVGLNTGQWQVDLEIEQGFFSVFFDNLISDWIVQQRIVKAKGNVNSKLTRLSQVINSIHQEQGTVQDELHRLEATRRTILSQ
jgi:hypothetical protein